MVADDIPLLDAAIVELQVRDARAGEAQRRQHARREARPRRAEENDLDAERTDFLFARGEDDAQRSARTVADEIFFTAEEETVAVGFERRRDARRVGAALGLGEREEGPGRPRAERR